MAVFKVWSLNDPITPTDLDRFEQGADKANTAIADNTTQAATIANLGTTQTTQGNAITSQGTTITNQGNTITAQGTSITNLGNSITAIQNDFVRGSGAATTAGTATALTAVVAGFTLTDFATIKIKLHVDLGNAATLNVGGLGAVPLYDDTGAALLGGAKAGSVLTLNYNQTNNRFYVIGSAAAIQKTIERTDYRTYKTGKDANGIFTTVEQKRNDGTLAIRYVLSGGTSPSYTTRTITYYDTDGATLVKTTVRTLSYDGGGSLISEV